MQGPNENTIFNFSPTFQAPTDARIIFATLAELVDLGTSNANAYTYYEGMIVKCHETGLEYEWKEVNAAIEEGEIPGDFTYPDPWIQHGVTYSGRVFNFVPKIPHTVKPYGQLTILKVSGNTNLKQLEAGDYVVNSMLADGTVLLYGRYSGTGDGSDYDHYDSGFRSRFNPA